MLQSRLCPANIQQLNPNPPYNGLRRWSLGAEPPQGTSVLTKETPDSPFSQAGTQQGDTACEPGSVVSPDPRPAGASILDLQPPEL